MNYENILTTDGSQKTIARINNLTPTTQALWGKMNVAQMLAHLSVAYEMNLEDKHPAPNALAKIMLKLFVKKAVIGPKPYPKNSRTAQQFLITGDKDFVAEKARLVSYINRVASDGASVYEGKENQSFGKLTAAEWNTMYSKHLDHHLMQFGV